MFEKTITYFCHYKTASGERWHPYVIRGVDLKNDAAYIMRQYGAESSDRATLHIPLRNNQICDFIYLKPKAWESIPNDEKGRYITLQGGNTFDFFVEGETEYTEPVDNSEYRQGFYQFMKTTYDDVYAVSTVSGPYTTIPHFEILGR